MAHNSDTLQLALQTTGHRLTWQRRLVLDLLEQHGGHLDASELFRLARERNPRMSLATVYRTVALLRDVGLVDEVHLGEEHHHYEVKSRSEHGHLVCLECGRVLEFTSPLLPHLKAAVARQYGFAVTETQVDLAGYCAECSAKR